MAKRKKFLKTISAVTALTIVTGVSSVAAAAIIGDANGDGAVKNDDISTLGSFIVGTADTITGDADMNSDGVVNVFDMISLRRTVIDSSEVVEPTDPTEPTDPVEPVDNTITLDNSGITFAGVGAAVSEDKSVVTISQPGTYIVTGEMEGGQIVVDVDKTTYVDATVELSLEGMSLTNTSTSPVYIASVDDKCTITAKKNTVNTISDGSTAYTNADDDSGAIYSKDDLNFKGKGTLVVNGNYADAIVSKNDIKINNGTIEVNAADDGIRGKDSVTIGKEGETDYSGINVTVNSKAGDGIKSTETDTTSGKGFVEMFGGTVNINAFSDGIHASQLVNLNGGDITIKTTASSTSGETSAKGIKAGTTEDDGTVITGAINVNGGNINVNSTDDCIHASGNINLVGGVMRLASGDDAVHSDTDVVIGNGNNTFDDVTIVVDSCYEGIEGLNITQNSGTVIVNSTDDGYNAAGGADGSGTTSPGGWGGNTGMGGTAGNYSLSINGGFVLVNASNGDHDGIDSNGSLSINGGYAITNGQDAFDCDGTMSYTGGVYVKNTGSGGMGGMGGMGGSGSMTESVSVSATVNANTRITLVDGSGNVIVSFIADKSVSSIVAGCTAYTGASVYTGGELSGSTYFQTIDETQLAAYGGTLTGGTQLTSSGNNSNTPW